MADIFVIPSSSGVGFYQVEVSTVSGGIKLVCNCQAGQFGKMCKHKLKVIRAALGLESKAGIDGNLEAVAACVGASGLPALLHELVQLERAAELARVRVTNAKKALERHLANGA